MGYQMGKCASRGDREHKAHVSPRAEASRERRPERKEPRHVDTDVEKVGVEEGVGEKRPQVGAEAARKYAAGDGSKVVARRE